MKKISAMLVSLVMACSMLAACGEKDDDSSSKKDKKETSTSQAADEKKEADESKDEADDGKDEPKPVEESEADSEPEAPVEAGSFAKAYSEKINAGAYSMDMTIESDFMGEMPVTMSVKDGNAHIIMNVLGMNTEVYIVDGKSYTILADAKMYQVEEHAAMEDMGLDTFSLADGATLLETKEEDGMVVEVYTVAGSLDVELGEGVEMEGDTSYDSTVSYYFDAAGDLKKVVSTDSFSGTTTATINSLSFDVEDIVLPDFTGWTEMTDDMEMDDETAIKLTLSMFGVTEEQVTGAGYTYAQLAEMDDEELMKVLEELGVDMSEILGM